MSLRWLVLSVVGVCLPVFLGGCISPDNSTVEGTGTPNVTQCSSLGFADGADFEPQKAIEHGVDGRTHPDLFYIAWAQLDDRTDLRFPAQGYSDAGFEDKLIVSRRNLDGEFDSWQIWPPMDNDCNDTEQVRIHSFDVAPDGSSLFVSMSRGTDNNKKLGIYRLHIADQTITPIKLDSETDLMYPTYIGNDPDTGHEILMLAKTVTEDDIPINYLAARSVLVDEYDRAPTPLIHRLDVTSGALTRIGFNNSHQTEPMVMDGPDNNKLVVFTQWEHQQNINRFSLWKTQIDGSDNFTFYGDESATDDSDQNLYQARVVRSGPYKDYVLMGQGARSNHSFVAEGHILMTKREHLELRSDKIFLQKLDNSTGNDVHITRTPEHYNDESFAYAYREDVDNTYKIYVKDFPETASGFVDHGNPGTLVMKHKDYHFMQPRSFYPPTSTAVAPTDGTVGQSRVSFTNNNLSGRAGFLVQNLTQSDNGMQSQLDGVDPNDVSMQFFIPSHHISGVSEVVSPETSAEASIPASGFIKPESDGSLGVVLKEGLYVWKVNKAFKHPDGNGGTQDIWIPVRSEAQEVSFVKNRVNACNQCHQERSQANLDLYATYESEAAKKMKGDLSDIIGTDKDISGYSAYNSVPDFHKDIAPLFTKAPQTGNSSCADCHNAKDRLNLANMTGPNSANSTFRNLLYGAHKVGDTEEVVPYVKNTLNPMGSNDAMGGDYSPAPFLWSLLLNDDLTVPEDAAHPDNIGRNLDRKGDYGAKYNEKVAADIAEINGKYDHSNHWSAADIQKFITYTSTRIPVGIKQNMAADKSFTVEKLETGTIAAQKAYQSMLRNCFSCHNNKGSLYDAAEGKPLEKRFTTNNKLGDSTLRFSINSHLSAKDSTSYADGTGSYDLLTARKNSTLSSALYRIDFTNKDDSELLVYARGGVNADGTAGTGFNDNVTSKHPALAVVSEDYKALDNWVKEVVLAADKNKAPTLEAGTTTVTINEYDNPTVFNGALSWSDADDVGGTTTQPHEWSHAFISGRGSGSAHDTFNDTMIGLSYNDFNNADLKMYAILGDRTPDGGETNLTFRTSDGILSSDTQSLKVVVKSDYQVPTPSETMPDVTAFYTERSTGDLYKLESSAGSSTRIGTIANYSTSWTTMYRRADKGWLYFFDQNAQTVHVVDESNAQYLFAIRLDHTLNKDPTSDSHKQTVYLIWWRPAEGVPGDANYQAGRLEGLMESKLAKEAKRNGDFHVYLGTGETAGTITPGDLDWDKNEPSILSWDSKLPDGDSTVGVYVWKRATFMSKWVSSPTDNNGQDRLNVLNLVTGKPKPLADYSFEEKAMDGVTYPAHDYINVRAVVVAEDGAFYGFNKDLNSTVEVFSFDPLEGIQQPVTNIPTWIQDLINDPLTYATPFVTVAPRTAP